MKPISYILLNLILKNRRFLGKNYIHRADDSNLIEIRLTKTKGGYGLCISTTATNKIQNRWIAKHLKNNFGN